MQKLNKNGPLTLTYQLTEILREQINTIYSPGSLLPTEKELAADYNVSSITVRNALENLVQEELVYRQRGKGTFVIEKKISSNAMRLQSGTQLFQECGMSSYVIILERSDAIANLSLANQLEIQVGEPVHLIVRQRLLENIPYSIETTVVSKQSYPNLFHEYDRGSLYEFLEQQHGICISRSPQRYTAIALDSKQAKILGHAEGSPAILLRGIIFDQNDKLVGYEESIYRHDKFEISVEANSNHLTTKKLISQSYNPLI